MYVNAPNAVPGCEMAESLSLGHTALAPDEIEDVVDALLPDFQPSSYNVLRRNCHHFSDELCFRLLGRRLPSWINRAARVGTRSPRDAAAARCGAARPGRRPRRRRRAQHVLPGPATEAREMEFRARGVFCLGCLFLKVLHE